MTAVHLKTAHKLSNYCQFKEKMEDFCYELFQKIFPLETAQEIDPEFGKLGTIGQWTKLLTEAVSLL